MNKKVLIIGGRRKAKVLAESLLKKNYLVTIVNKKYEDCLMLSENEKLSVILGDGTKPYVLEEAKAQEMNIVIALTSSDEDNLIICELSKKKFFVKKTVSILSDLNKTEFFYNMGIDHVVCATSELTNIIEKEALLDRITNKITLLNNDVGINEILITKEDLSYLKKISELDLLKEVIIVCIIRENNILIPNGNTVIYENDILITVSKANKTEFIIKKLKG